MAKKSTRRETVCLLSHHRLALEGFERALEPLDHRLSTLRLESNLVPDLANLEVPEALVYVVDTLPAQQATAALVGGIRQKNPEARMVALAEEFEEAATFPLLRLGIKGLVRYADAETQLPRAVESVAGGGYWVSRALLSRFVDSMLAGTPTPQAPDLPSEISPREREVLDALLENFSNKEIGNKLNISERTVKFHVSNLLQKFSVQRRADLILLCYQNRPATG
jgi:DNA-binding NarL/FixJ family response regulator